MRRRAIDPHRPGEDWEGNNIAITCPVCGKVYIVSELIHHGERPCPACGASTGRVRAAGRVEARRKSAGVGPATRTIRRRRTRLLHRPRAARRRAVASFDNCSTGRGLRWKGGAENWSP
jgi:hypothetical protein